MEKNKSQYTYLKTKGINYTPEGLSNLINNLSYKKQPEAEMFFDKILKDEFENEWEAKRTAELQESLSDGAYDISAGNIQLITGKGGAIMFQIALEKRLYKFKKR